MIYKIEVSRTMLSKLENRTDTHTETDRYTNIRDRTQYHAVFSDENKTF